MLHRDLVRGTRHNFECGTWNESGGRADRLRWHGGIVRTGYDERWRFDLRKQASRFMALDRCERAGEYGNCRCQDYRLSHIHHTLVGRKSVATGTSVTVLVNTGCCRIIKKQTNRI